MPNAEKQILTNKQRRKRKKRNSIGEVYRSSINERKQIKIEIRIQNNELNVHVKQVDNWEQKLVERHKMKDQNSKGPKDSLYNQFLLLMDVR